MFVNNLFISVTCSRCQSLPFLDLFALMTSATDLQKRSWYISISEDQKPYTPPHGEGKYYHMPSQSRLKDKKRALQATDDFFNTSCCIIIFTAKQSPIFRKKLLVPLSDQRSYLLGSPIVQRCNCGHLACLHKTRANCWQNRNLCPPAKWKSVIFFTN